MCVCVFLSISCIQDHVICKQRQCYSFFSSLIPFMSLSCLIALAGTSSTTVNRSVSGRHLGLGLDLKEKHLIFYHQVLFSCGLFTAFTKLKKILPTLVCWVLLLFLITRRCWVLSNAFFPTIKMISWFLSLLYECLVPTFWHWNVLKKQKWISSAKSDLLDSPTSCFSSDWKYTQIECALGSGLHLQTQRGFFPTQAAAFRNRAHFNSNSLINQLL